MIKHEAKVCLFCGDLFVPHPKVGSRQLICGKKSECRRLRIRRTKNLWNEKDRSYNYSCVQKSRKNHPDTQKNWRQRKKQQRQAQLGSSPAEAISRSSASQKVRRPGPKNGKRFASEIRNQLTITKTTAQLDLFGSEIRNQLSLSITLQLSELLALCTKRKKVR